MTLEMLLASSADELDKLSDEDLRKHFEPMFSVTHPDLSSAVYKETSAGGKRVKKLSEVEQLLLSMGGDKKANFMKLAGEAGLNLEDML